MKTSTKIEIGILAVAALIILLFQLFMRADINQTKANRIEFSGQVESKDFPIVSFKELVCYSDFKVEYLLGEPKVTLTTDPTLLDKYEITVADGKLKISSDALTNYVANDLRDASVLKIYNTDSLTSLNTYNNTSFRIMDGLLAQRSALYGRGNSSISSVDTLNVEYLLLDLEGNSNINLSGRVDDMVIESDGNSRFNVSDLRAQTLRIASTGNSRGHCYASRVFDGVTNGNAQIVISGDPEKSKSVAKGNSSAKFE